MAKPFLHYFVIRVFFEHILHSIVVKLRSKTIFNFSLPGFVRIFDILHCLCNFIACHISGPFSRLN